MNGGIGFRDLESFNLALRAKQAWRIKTQPQPLLSRVMKAHYFPYSSLELADLGDRPSTTWHGIFNARNFLAEWTRVRIGNGATTSIWEDAWLRFERTGRIITTRPISSTFLDKVEDIIDWDIGCWNSSLIYQYLWPIDRDRIFQVPIGLVTTPDCLYWSHSKTGKFTLRSCYHMILDSKLRGKETKAGAFSGVTSIYWKRLWAICLPPKIRVLL